MDAVLCDVAGAARGVYPAGHHQRRLLAKVARYKVYGD